jgi:hypothetical protein
MLRTGPRQESFIFSYRGPASMDLIFHARAPLLSPAPSADHVQRVLRAREASPRGVGLGNRNIGADFPHSAVPRERATWHTGHLGSARRRCLGWQRLATGLSAFQFRDSCGQIIEGPLKSILKCRPLWSVSATDGGKVSRG